MTKTTPSIKDTDEISTFTIIINTVTLTVLLGFIGYYIWVFYTFMSIDQELQVAYLAQSACMRSPLEIETIRYTMSEYLKKYTSFMTTFHTMNAIWVVGSFVLIIIYFKLKETQILDYLSTIFLCSLLLWIVISSYNIFINFFIITKLLIYSKIY